MKKDTLTTIFAIVGAVVAVAAAVCAVLYFLDKKGVLKLQKTDYCYEEDFPDEEIVVE